MELIVDGRPIGAREALRIGAINRVVPDDRLREETIAWAAHIARWPAAALVACKRSMLEGIDMPLLDARRNEQSIFREVATTDEALRLMSEAQAKYESGADSYEAIGLERAPGS
jgi:enoyl-CoA hydratase/carnithine racemase